MSEFKAMKIEDFRDLASAAFRKASELKSCVSDVERKAWIASAEKLRLQIWASTGTCKRALASDVAKMERAKAALDAAYASVSGLVLMDSEEVAEVSESRQPSKATQDTLRYCEAAKRHGFA